MSKIRLIVDVSNICYRAAFGNPTLKTSKGKFSGHVFGAVSSLLAVLRNELKDREVQIVFCYDGPNSKDYRRTILPSYKANREKRELDPLPEACEVLKTWPGIHIEQADKEGDDGMAYAVQMLNGQPCVIFSGDKDLWSLLQKPNVRVLSPNLRRFVEQADVYEHYHLNSNPGRIYLAKALFGDSSDGIKGVERLTKKQVEPYLNASNVETPEQFYTALGDIKPKEISAKNWEKLNAEKNRVFDNYSVILPQLGFSKESVTKVPDGYDNLKKWLVEYECFSLLEQLDLTKTA